MKIEYELNIEHFGKKRLMTLKNEIDTILIEHEKKREMEIENYKSEISALKGKLTKAEKQKVGQRGRKKMFNVKRTINKGNYNENVEINVPYTELQEGDKIL